MTRLTAEIAEGSKPDAASKPSGPGPGTPGRVGAVACRNAPWRRGRWPKPRRSGRTAFGHQWRIKSLMYVLQGLCGASLKHRAWDAGGTGGLAVSSIRNALASRDARVRGSEETPASRAPSDFLIQDR